MLPQEPQDTTARSPSQQHYTLQNGQERITLSLDKGLLWSTWEREGRSLFAHPGSVIGPHAGARSTLETDLFVDGVGAFAPWECISSSDTQLIARLQGTQKWHDQSLSSIEEQTFLLDVTVTLNDQGVLWKLSVRAESDGVIGLRLPVPLSSSTPQTTVDSLTTAHFVLPSDVTPIRGRLTAPNAEWSSRVNMTHSTEQLVICTARFPEKPILTINSIDILFNTKASIDF